MFIRHMQTDYFESCNVFPLSGDAGLYVLENKSKTLFLIYGIANNILPKKKLNI